jgi:hypothetical protein
MRRKTSAPSPLDERVSEDELVEPGLKLHLSVDDGQRDAPLRRRSRPSDNKENPADSRTLTKVLLCHADSYRIINGIMARATSADNRALTRDAFELIHFGNVTAPSWPQYAPHAVPSWPQFNTKERVAVPSRPQLERQFTGGPSAVTSVSKTSLSGPSSAVSPFVVTPAYFLAPIRCHVPLLSGNCEEFRLGFLPYAKALAPLPFPRGIQGKCFQTRTMIVMIIQGATCVETMTMQTTIHSREFHEDPTKNDPKLPLKEAEKRSHIIHACPIK